jgi:hypothetical protein
MAQATAPILDSTSSSNRCNAPIRSLSEAQRTCREIVGRVDPTLLSQSGSRVCIAAVEDECLISYSITSSACGSTIGGTSMVRALAVLRLITSSYLVGFCAGRAEGFAPLRIRFRVP